MAGRIPILPLEKKPFPHFVLDDVFDGPSTIDIHNYWPERELFNEVGVPGSALFMFAPNWEKLSPQSHKFWSSFSQVILLPMFRATFQKFAPIYEAKFGKQIEHVLFYIRLMESLERYVEQPVHTHHFHNPNWLFTNLVYIDAGTKITQGTTLFGTPDYTLPQDAEQIAQIAAQTLIWEDMDEIQPVKTVDFVPNRMLSLIDSPISYHGVLPVELTDAPPVRRRIIRCHAEVSESHINTVYGVRPIEYRYERTRASRKPRVLNWLKDEILQNDLAMETSDCDRAAAYTGSICFETDVPLPNL